LYEKDLSTYKKYNEQKWDYAYGFILNFEQSSLGSLVKEFDTIGKFTDSVIEQGGLLSEAMKVAL
jgi:hypothetical protein